MAETIRLGTKTEVGQFAYGWKGNGPVCRIVYIQDVNGDGTDEVIFAGWGAQSGKNNFHTSTKVQIFGWQDNRLINLSNSLLPNGAGQVEGVGDVKFGDFNGDGLTDIFLSGYADMNHQLGVYALMNRGGRFERVKIDECDGWQHGAAAYDLNRDGYMDVVCTGYGTSQRVYLGGPSGLTPYKFATIGGFPGGSGVAVGDFLGDNGVQFVLVDGFTSESLGWTNAKDTVLSRLRFLADNTPQLEEISSLPLPILEQPRFGNFTKGFYDNSHDIRSIAMDFTKDGRVDVINLSVGGYDGKQWVNKGAVQLLKNLGNGQFEDVTDTLLRGFSNDANVGYAPVIRDFNGDGFLDIYLGEQNTNTRNSSFFLLGDADGGFTEVGRSYLTGRVGDAVSTVAKGPDGKFYVVWDYGPVDPVGIGKVALAEVSFSGTSTSAPAGGTAKSDKLSGTSGADSLAGLAGNDVLLGGDGDDTLVGGPGKDTLTGGSGADVFVFDAAASSGNYDVIKDFATGSDKIQLSASVFKLPAGVVDAKYFIAGTKAVTADQHLIYNGKQLLFDVDGSGKAAAVAVVAVTGLQVTDILVV